MCQLRYKAFNELPAEDKKMIAEKFSRGKMDKQKIIRLPAVKSVWLLVPEGKTQKNIMKAQQLIKNFGMPNCIISTEIPRSFLQAV